MINIIAFLFFLIAGMSTIFYGIYLLIDYYKSDMLKKRFLFEIIWQLSMLWVLLPAMCFLQCINISL